MLKVSNISDEADDDEDNIYSSHKANNGTPWPIEEKIKFTTAISEPNKMKSLYHKIFKM